MYSWRRWLIWLFIYLFHFGKNGLAAYLFDGCYAIGIKLFSA
jgi:hypothetical protein